MPWNRDTKDSTTEAGGYPTLASTPSPPDNDIDGIPNEWESTFGSDPNLANHNADADGDGYTDLEEYLNWLAAPHAITPKDEAVDIDLVVQNGNRTGLTYTVASPVNGAVTLLGDGRTARFKPTPGFQGLGSFTFSFTASGQTVVQTVGVAITSGRPKDLIWTGTTATWDLGTTANFTNGASAATYTLGDNVSFLQIGSNPTITVSGTLSGAMNLIKAGSGTLTLNAANAFTGGTVVLIEGRPASVHLSRLRIPLGVRYHACFSVSWRPTTKSRLAIRDLVEPV